MITAEKEMLDLFVQESEEHLATLETDIIALEAEPQNDAVLNRIFRSVHSVKGTSGFFGLTNITGLAHVMESVMALVREGKKPVTKQLINALLSGTDKLRIMVGDPGNSDKVATADDVAAFQDMLVETPPKVESSTQPVSPKPSSLERFTLDSQLVEDALKHGHCVYALSLRLREDLEAAGRTPLDYFHEIESLGTFIDSYTDIEGITGLDDAIDGDIHYGLLFSTVMQPDLVCTAFGLQPEQVEEIPQSYLKEWLDRQPTISAAPEQPKKPAVMPTTSPAPEPVDVKKNRQNTESTPDSSPSAAQSESKTGRIKTEETIRISVSLLDSLMNLAGEMVLRRNQLIRIAEGQNKDATNMQGVLQNINSITTELQETVMRTRLQPVAGLFGKFHRVVRDLGGKLGKEIDLTTVGEEVELDRSILEGLSDPLTHLVRNSADHGIEQPEVRVKNGKPRNGHIILKAAHVGGSVQLEIIDDGKGINPTMIKSKAVEKGLISTDAALEMSDREARQLIFAPGFSTADAVSDVSGRGVGMDVVKTNIEKLGGRVEIESETGQGTTIIIRLPLTLAIVPSLLASCSGRQFAIPQVNIEEIVHLSDKRRTERIGGMEVFRLRGQLLPVTRMHELLQIESGENVGRSDRGFLVVLKSEQHRYGLFVDLVADTEEIVVKPLSRYLKEVKIYSGATILGDGRVAMIIDTTGVAGVSGINFETARLSRNLSQQNQANSAMVEKQSVLLFKDVGREVFAIHLANVGRIERITPDQIENVGDHQYYRHQDQLIQLVRLQDHLPITKSSALGEEIFVIVPRLVRRPIGILASNILDAVDTTVELDTKTIRSNGLLGSSCVRDRLTLFVNVYGLIDSVCPITEQEKSEAMAGARILYAEDTAFFREVVTRYLKGSVRSVDVVNDGQEAWEKLQSNNYDLVLTDIEMPHVDGFELTRRIRSNDRLKKLPVIALSARGNDSFRERGSVVGITHYETKLDQERLRTAILSALSK